MRALSLVVPAPELQPIDEALEPGQGSLRISSLSIEGFGALSGVEIGELSETMTVLLGPNEAGKSTIFDFIAAMLFGFPSRKADGRYRSPVRGGRHGGRLSLTDRNGSRWVIERFATPQKVLTVTRPDRSQGEEEDLRRLLGGATAELFRAVFAVGLDDLRQIEGMSSDEVREVLFSSSILGQKRSAARALKELEAQRDELVRPQKGGRANELVNALQEAWSKLSEARQQASGFPALVEEQSRLALEIEELNTSRDKARRRARNCELLTKCWEVHRDVPSLRAELAETAPLSEEEASLLGLKGRLGTLSSQLSGHAERVRRLAESLTKSGNLQYSVEKRLTELGGEWARKLAEDPAFEADAWRTELQGLLETLGRAKGKLETAEETVSRETEEMSLLADSGALSEASSLPSAEALTKRLASLRTLRGWTAEREQLARDVERDAEAARREDETGAENLSAGRTALYLAVLSVALVAVAAGLAVRHEDLFAGAVLAIALVVALVALLGRRSAGGPGISRSQEDGVASSTEALKALRIERMSRFETAKRRVNEAAAALGLPGTVSFLGVEEEIGQTERLLHERQAVDSSATLCEQAARGLADATRALERARLEVASAEAAISGFALRLGIPEDDASSLPNTVEQLSYLSERLKGLARLEDEVRAAEGEILSFEAGVNEFARRFGLALPVTEEGSQLSAEGAEIVLSQIGDVIDRLETRAAERRRVEQALADAEGEIDRMLGRGEMAELLRRELSSGHLLDWETELSTAVRTAEEAERRHEHLVREHEGVSLQISQLTSSSDVPQLEQDCLRLEEQLRATMTRYVVVSGARLLLQRTLKRYEQQRQPAVLEHAAAHFERATDGRYVRLGVDSGPDGSKPSVKAFGPDDSFVEASSLSRGTMEQLYLCIRLGLAESFAERYAALPVVLDDVLVNCDPERCQHLVAELLDTASRHQVLFLTCHPEVAALVTAAAERTKRSLPAPVRTIELARI